MDWYQRAQQLFDYSQAIRRDLHRHPELGFKEVRTAGIVASELRQLGLEVHTGIAETGVVGLLEGDLPGPVVLLRFDMDALPVNEQTGAEYCSQMPGQMHACGHDGHVAIGLTVARLLNEQRAHLPGSVKFVFQPAEEGLGGMERMLVEGVLKDPAPRNSLALHIWNDKPLGWVGVPAGPLMAGAEIFDIYLEGKGGHGALPHLAVDPVAAAAQIVLALQTIVSRNVSPLEAAVVSVTKIRAGEVFNVIPASAEMSGTIRTFEPTVREKVIARFEQVVKGVAEAMGCQVKVDLRRLTPSIINEAGLARKIAARAAEMYPNGQVDDGYRTMVSEDMAFLMERVPGCYFMVGSANDEKGLVYGHHHPRFDFDEKVLPRAAALMAAAALEALA
jgi:amidohydrolase